MEPAPASESILDIGSGGPFPADALSNFMPNTFVFDGVVCNSMEGLLQSFKFENIARQLELCLMVGVAAKRLGRKRNRAWRAAQTLWWKGLPLPRNSEAFQTLLDAAFDALFQDSADFRQALAASGTATLRHSLGNPDPTWTVLTEQEMCSRLTKLRASP